MYLISAYFDDNPARLLQGFIDEIYAVTGNDFMIRNQVPPHLTLCAFEQRSDDAAKSLFAEMKEMLSFGEIEIASIGAFLPYVLFAQAVTNEYLFNLNDSIVQVLGKNEDTIINRFYKPYAWMPHITLGKTLKEEQMQKAFNVLQKSFTPFKAEIASFGLAKPNPHKNLEMFYKF